MQFDILNVLREETREEHRVLEASLPLMSPSFTIRDYIHLLQKFYGLYLPLERKLAAGAEFQRAIGDWESRRKTPAIAADLTTLGMSPDDISRLPIYPLLIHEPQSAASEFGTAYVLEGATLGGQIISRHLEKQLGVTPESGGRFFSSYGDKVGSMWKRFQKALTGQATEANREEIVGSAKQTFSMFREWLKA